MNMIPTIARAGWSGAFLWCCLVLFPGLAVAAQVTVDFSGTVTSASITVPDCPALAITSGTSFSGSYTFESTTPDGSPSASSGFYPALSALSVDVGGELLVSAVSGIIAVTDAAADAYQVNASVANTTCPGGTILDILLTLQDSDGAVFTSDALPTSLDFAEFEDRDFQITDFGGVLSIQGTIQAVDVSGISISGNVSSDCQAALSGVTVSLISEDMHQTVTDGNGDYVFEDVPVSSQDADLSLVLPLGFEPDTVLSFPDAETVITPDQDQVVDFVLSCVDAVEDARSKGYWKHEAFVYITGHGHAKGETQEDMETNFPQEIFNHFHENLLNSIAVEGVTFIDDGGGPEPLDLETIGATLKASGGDDDDDDSGLQGAKQHYLALLLNLASGKLRTFTVVSQDGATASQALQHVADLINTGSTVEWRQASKICKRINHNKLVGEGEIPLSIDDIAYSRPRGWDAPLQVSPNPGGIQTYRFSFGVPVSGETALEIFDVTGRKVATPASGLFKAGRGEASWDGRASDGHRLGSGMYFARLTTAEGMKSAKIVHRGR
jgi:hypothetical protein